MSKFLDQLMQLIQDNEWEFLSKTTNRNSVHILFSVPSKEHNRRYKVTIVTFPQGVIMSLGSGVDASPWSGLEPFLRKLFFNNADIAKTIVDGRFSFNLFIDMEPTTKDVNKFVDTATTLSDRLLEAISRATKAITDYQKELAGTGDPQEET